MSNLRALDLCCCAGGATRGLQMAGFHVTGVDIKRSPRYIGDSFILADALEVDISGYDLIWASPPCQRYSEAVSIKDRFYSSDLLPRLRERLSREAKVPYIIENVEGAKKLLREPVFLCGTMFGLNIWRHRFFEIGNSDCFFLLPPCNHSGRPVLITGRGMGMDKNGNRRSEDLKIIKEEAIGIDWMITSELDEAIPPAYSKFLAEAIIQWEGL